MATQNLIEQHILFIDINQTGTIDELGILANSLIKSLANNSVGNDVVAGFDDYLHWDGSNWVGHGFYEIKCYVSAAFQTTIQQNMATLQSAFPGYKIVTYGFPVTWGF